MIKYFIGTLERTQELTIAYDKANGLMAADGTPTPKRARIFRNGVDVTGDPRYDPNEHGIFVGTTTVFGAPITSPDIPGEGALRYDQPSEEVDPWHGLTVAGTEMPDEFEWLVESELPPRWRAVFFPAPFPGGAGASATIQVQAQVVDGAPHLDIDVEHD
jgi:hypothetical protein